MTALTTADLWLFLFVAIASLVASGALLIAWEYLTAKPAPESPVVVEQLDAEYAVLRVRGAER